MWVKRHIGFMRLGFIFLVFGAVAIVVALVFAYYTESRIKNWEEVEGVVIRTEVVTTKDPYDPKYNVEVTFAYEFDGKMYHSTILSGWWRGGSGAEAAKVQEAASCAKGSTRKLSVNPSNPHQISILLGYNLRSFQLPLFLGGFGLLFLLVGLLIRKFHLSLESIIEKSSG